jgi:chemotaxis response regulator CheB
MVAEGAITQHIVVGSSARGIEALPALVAALPADQHADISDSHLNLHSESGGVRPKPSINLLFSCATSAYGEGLLAVILTGTGSDGAAGATGCGVAPRASRYSPATARPASPRR